MKEKILKWMVDSTRIAELDPDFLEPVLKDKFSEYPVRLFFSNDAEEGQELISSL